ncbi:MAG: transcriptional regulator [Phormidium sp. SL48-SHIP]|nr:MAG: transcriptional regulator [Phormidium sp. SL48-SHIP]
MATPTYDQLLIQVQPKPIQSLADYEAMLSELDRLMEIEESQLSDDETSMLELLAILIEDYERKTYPMPNTASPHDVLDELVAAHQLRQKDLLDIFGSKGIASEVFNRKRGISKTQAKALGERFKVSPSVFL